jgi:hypothetical protein
MLRQNVWKTVEFEVIRPKGRKFRAGAMGVPNRSILKPFPHHATLLAAGQLGG